MNLYPQKKEEEQGIELIDEQNRIESSNQEEKLPEFDEFGTALNDI